MTTLSRATAAPVPVTIAGREWQLSRLTLRDLGELDNWARAQAITAARESLPPDATQQERDDTLQAAVKAAMTMRFFTGWRGLEDTVIRIPRVLMQMLRRCHPEITFDEAERLMIEDSAGVLAAINLAKSLWGREPKKTDEPATGAAAAPAATPQAPTT